MLGRRLRISSRLQKYRERHRRRAGRVQVESFPRAHYSRALLQEVAVVMNDEINIQPHDFKDRIVFMSMYNDIAWTKKNNKDTCHKNSSRVSEYALQVPAGFRTFLDISRLRR